MLWLQLPFDLLVGLGILLASRWLGRQSTVVRAIVIGGILVRTAVGLLLFWISYLQLPVMQNLQYPGGFWWLMIDATGYYWWAVDVVERGLAIPPGAASPFFSRSLALWMRLAGVAPMAGMFFNLCLYLGSCLLLTRLYRPINRWRADLPLIITVAAISFSPVLLVNSTQPLKDEAFLALIIGICAAVKTMLDAMVSNGRTARVHFVVALLALAAGTASIAGIRFYYAIVVWCSLVAALATLVLFVQRRHWLINSMVGVVVLSIVWSSYWFGAGTYYRPRPEEQRRILEAFRTSGRAVASTIFGDMATTLNTARAGFAASGGGTNIVRRGGSSVQVAATRSIVESPPSPIVAAAPDAFTRWSIVLGWVAIVVPISLMRALSLVDIAGGRGLLPFADVDTLFMDASLLALAVLLVRRRHLIGKRLAFAAFAVSLFLLMAVLLGYVVTNVGTMFRMRYMVAAPFWALALAVSPARPAETALQRRRTMSEPE